MELNKTGANSRDVRYVPLGETRSRASNREKKSDEARAGWMRKEKKREEKKRNDGTRK